MENRNIDGKELLVGYDGHYSENGFWDKVKDVAKVAGAKVVYYALLLFYTATSKSTPTQAKVLIYSAIGYFILPVDLIPDAIPFIGFSDDLAALVACYNAVKDNITPTIEKQAQRKLKDWFGEVSENEIKGYLE